MKRMTNLFPAITNIQNLMNAAQKAYRGKKNNQEANLFYFNLESEILKLEAALINMTYHPAPYRSFKVYEPKERDICAASFRDRVVHHAIGNILDPIYEKSFINDSYACRKNKGVYAALLRTQVLSRKFKFFLKCDIRKYFETIDHTILKEIICRKIKDKQLIELLNIIIDHPFPKEQEKKGIPIGNLTSQLFANIYLDQLDHFIKDDSGVKGYIRYMDDFLLFAQSSKQLRMWQARLTDMIEKKLKLELKYEVLQLMPVFQGIPFLGFRIFPGLVRLQRKKLMRFRQNYQKKEKQYFNGEIDKDFFIASIESMIAHISWANTYQMQQSFFNTGPCP
ncbi:MAG: group II intron reverse transcriptase domain-containing protein [Candidatus Magnetomorum sp.]|nr:group II intron reverse transcriptase domain-containing protein [Candidatus Magnetomorum sp.]